MLSRHTVLPWEDAGEYRALLDALAAEHNPRGPTEEHLVEEIAGVMWRKRRLRLAEAAAHRRALERAAEPYRRTAQAALVHLPVEEQVGEAADAIRATPGATVEDLAEVEVVEAMTRRALDLLGSADDDTYEAALTVLHEETRQWWEDTLSGNAEAPDGEESYTADIAGLQHFLESEVLQRLKARRDELANRSLVREQAFGEALDPDTLDRLGRYEVHLDRKLERTLSMLLKLKELRSSPSEA